MGSSRRVRCAIYTRVSTDQGLEQDFNSLDAQYDASQAYIRSQAHAGWTLIRSKFDDGGAYWRWKSRSPGGRPRIGKEVRDLIRRMSVTAQVVLMGQQRRRDIAKFAGSRVRASMMFQPCFLAVEKKERMSAKSIAPSGERKPPEIFCRSFIMRPSRSA